MIPNVPKCLVVYEKSIKRFFMACNLIDGDINWII